MDEKGVLNSCEVVSEDQRDTLYPMFFGVSCALFALRLLSEPEMNDDKLSEIRDGLRKGSAHLLGLLVWRVQRDEANSGKSEIIHKLEREIEELKRRRSEDAKANEKVVGIFAAQEQIWLSERKKLRQQIGALLNEYRVQQSNMDGAISEFNDKLEEKEQEKEYLLQSKDDVLELEGKKIRELEEKLNESRNVTEELRETAKREAQDHSLEIWKHKTAFIELVSNQRQLEAEMGRAVRQVESIKIELDSVMEEKEESLLMVQKLSMGLIKAQKDLEQKDKILSAMLRKSKLDTTEKQMLLKEMKLSKAMRKEAETEMERLRAVPEPRRERHSLKSMLSKHSSVSKLEAFSDGRGVHSPATVSSRGGRSRSQSTDFVLEYEESEQQKELEGFSSVYDKYSQEGSGERTDVRQLEGWVRSEAEKYNMLVEQRHHLEINAFAEQLRLKDEKLEAFRWRFLSMEMELKQLQSHIEGLNHDLSQVRQDNTKLDALLSDREAEINSLKQQFVLQLESLSCRKMNLNSPSNDPDLGNETDWSKVKIIKSKPGGVEEEETETDSTEISQKMDARKEEETFRISQSKDIILTIQSPGKEFEEEKDVLVDTVSIPEEVEIGEKSPLSGQSSSKSSITGWKLDLHALGVSYKVKRLKQQLLMLERLTGKRESFEDREGDDSNKRVGIKGLHTVISLLNKQATRYQSLQSKIDELCKRMQENDLDVGHGGSSVAKTKEETKRLEHFLEETFQLQRYMVATGQKLMEVQSKIASGFVEAGEDLDESASFDLKRFADSVRTLFKEVQRGLEIRIARIIGDLGGTLACDGIIHLRK